MGDKSKIGWTDASWTAIRARNLATGKVGWHCEHVTPGCEHCYSEALNKRLGTELPFKPGHRKDVEIFLDEKMLTQPLRWKRPRMVFVCSMTDIFASFVPDEWIDRIFAVMALCPQHVFQCLTKRSKRMREYTQSGWQDRIGPIMDKLRPTPVGIWGFAGPYLDNCWLGVSCEDQARADERIPDLLATPAAVRWVSAEPLLGPIDFTLDSLVCTVCPRCSEFPFIDPETNAVECSACDGSGKSEDWGIDWIVAGGESGPGHRPMKIEWAESIREQCKAAGIAFYFKQSGGPKPGRQGTASDELWACKEFPS